MAVTALSPKASARQTNNPNPLVLVDPAFTDLLRAKMADFSGHLLVMCGIGKSTINNYLKMVAKALKEIGTLTPSHAQVQQRIGQMFAQGLSYHHITNTMRAVEAYMAFIGDPIKFGRPKKPKRILKDSLTEAEISVILAACRNIREKAILTLLAYTGIRNQELCNLKVQDIDFGRNLVQVFGGKGAKDRVVCMAGECTTVLLRYLSEHPRQPDAYLFTTIRTNKQYTTWAMRRLIKVVVGRTGNDKRVYPHLFRHSLANNMLARGANLLTIKEQLGHTFIDTTMIYIKSRPHRVQTEYQMFTPSYI